VGAIAQRQYVSGDPETSLAIESGSPGHAMAPRAVYSAMHDGRGGGRCGRRRRYGHSEATKSLPGPGDVSHAAGAGGRQAMAALVAGGRSALKPEERPKPIPIGWGAGIIRGNGGVFAESCRPPRPAEGQVRASRPLPLAAARPRPTLAGWCNAPIIVGPA